MPRGTKRKLPENVEEVGEDDTRLLQPDPGRGFIDFEKIIRASKIVPPINTRNVEGCGVSGESTLSFPVIENTQVQSLASAINQGQNMI